MDALVRALLPYVGRICGAIALERGDDAVQETMIAVLRNVASLREPAAIRGWVRRIAVREAVRVATVDATSVDPSSLEPLAGPVVELDTALDVRATLTELTPAHRAVLILRDIDGLAEADVAALLELPEGTVKSRLHRARAAFARKWEA
jgi:RNA polymerase sigma-70 factor (ECF subfamily)